MGRRGLGGGREEGSGELRRMDGREGGGEWRPEEGGWREGGRGDQKRSDGRR